MSDIKFYEYGPKTNSVFVKENLDPRNLQILTKKKLQEKNLVVLLHGYGANGQNLISLAPEFSNILPNSYFIAPNGVERWEGNFPSCYQWFSLKQGLGTDSIEQLAERIRLSNQKLKNFIDGHLQRLEIDHQNLLLIGFSQGAMMACYQAMIAPKKVASVISYSGKIILPQNVGQEIISKPKICLIHGKQDSVLPIEHFIEAKKIFQENQIPYEAYSFEGLDHSIDHRCVEAAKNFIQKNYL